jgi:hypothetical protein
MRSKLVCPLFACRRTSRTPLICPDIFDNLTDRGVSKLACSLSQQAAKHDRIAEAGGDVFLPVGARFV